MSSIEVDKSNMYEDKVLLWMDNHIFDYHPFVQEMESYGIKVLQADSIRSAIELLKNTTKKITTALLDIHTNENDSELTHQTLQHQIKLNNPESNLMYLTGFGGIEDMTDSSLTKQKVKWFRKQQMPRPSAKNFHSDFMKPIFSNTLNTLNSGNVVDGEELGQNQVSISKMSIKDYESLSSVQQIEIFREVETEVSPILQSEFSKGKYWVVFCKNFTEVYLSGHNPESLPTQSALNDILQDEGCIPYLFLAPVEINNLDVNWSAGCGGSFESYPTVTIQMPYIQDRMDFHFDTGCTEVYLDRPFLISNNIIKDKPFQFLCSQQSVDFEGSMLFERISINAALIDQTDESSIPVTIDGCAVYDWKFQDKDGNTSYLINRDCSDNCTVNTNSSICKYRNAFFGRTFITKNEISLILDGRNNKTRLENK